MKQILVGLLNITLLFSVMVSCDQEKTLMYKQEAGVYFLGQASGEYSFVGNMETVHKYNIRVSTTGDSVNYDRKVLIALVEGNANYVNTARPEQYKLLEGVVPAGAFEGEVPVEIHQTEDMNDNSFVIHVELVPNEDFPVAGFDKRYFTLLMTNQLIQPSNWPTLSGYFGNFSISWYRFILGVLDVSYIPIGGLVEEGDVEWGWEKFDAAVAKVKSELLKYNREHPGEPLRHEDGKYEGDEVVMP